MANRNFDTVVEHFVCKATQEPEDDRYRNVINNSRSLEVSNEKPRQSAQLKRSKQLE